MSLSRKAINFDLSTEELKKYFSDTREPYNSIKKFMLDNGFEHRQYSGYISKEPISDIHITSIVEKLSKKFIWLSNCAQKFDVTDIGAQHNLMHILKESAVNFKQTKNLLPLKFTQKQIKAMQEEVKKASQNIKSKDESKELYR